MVNQSITSTIKTELGNVSSDFGDDRFFDMAIHLCGNDCSISKQEIVDYNTSRICNDVHSHYFTFDELTAFLIANEELSDLEYYIGVYSFYVLSYICSSDHGDWDIIFHKIVRFFEINENVDSDLRAWHGYEILKCYLLPDNG